MRKGLSSISSITKIYFDFEAFFSNLIFVVIGVFIRSVLIIIGVFFEILIFFIGLLVFLSWFCLPIFLILGAYHGFRLSFYV